MREYLWGVHRWRDGSIEPSFESTTSTEMQPKMKQPRSGERRRQAAPHPGARRTGKSTPVSVVLIWRGGAEGWVEIRSPQGRWFRPYTHCIGGLVEELVRGGHMVTDNPEVERIKARRRRRAET